jgi:phosphopentomutase
MAGVEIALDERKPRVLAIALGETDEWGHGRRYDLYLNAAHNADQFLAKLWQQIQADPARRDRTTLLITTDHGRGPTRIDWTDHGSKIAGAENIWMAALGAGVPARGERRSIEVTQGQIAATVAKLLGEDFLSVQPKAAPPLPLAD